MENLSLSNPILPATLFAVAIASGAVLLIKRHSTTRPQVRECPHCKSIIGSSEPVCENCHRKGVFS